MRNTPPPVSKTASRVLRAVLGPTLVLAAAQGCREPQPPVASPTVTPPPAPPVPPAPPSPPPPAAPAAERPPGIYLGPAPQAPLPGAVVGRPGAASAPNPRPPRRATRAST